MFAFAERVNTKKFITMHCRNTASLFLKHIVFINHLNSPTELVTLRLVENLLDWNAILFAPEDEKIQKTTLTLKMNTKVKKKTGTEHITC